MIRRILAYVNMLPPKKEGWWQYVIYTARCCLYVYCFVILTTILIEAIQSYGERFTAYDMKLIEKAISDSKN